MNTPYSVIADAFAAVARSTDLGEMKVSKRQAELLTATLRLIEAAQEAVEEPTVTTIDISDKTLAQIVDEVYRKTALRLDRSPTEVAKALGVMRTAVYRNFKRLGLEPCGPTAAAARRAAARAARAAERKPEDERLRSE